MGREGAAQYPGLPQCLASGTGSGAAMAVAAGLADVGLATDHLAGIRVSCMHICRALLIETHNTTGPVPCPMLQPGSCCGPPAVPQVLP